VHLHLHTEYSLLDGVNRIAGVVKKAVDTKMPAVAISDHGVLYGAFEFWKTANENNVKPIIGCEIYVSPAERQLRQVIEGDKYYHLLVLAKNLQGYKNLVKLVSRSHLEGFYYRPRADKELLKEYSEGLIVTSACMGSPLGANIVAGKEKKALEWLKFLHSTFKDDFYLELQRHYTVGTDEVDETLLSKYDFETANFIKKQAMLNKRLIEYSKEYNIPLIATTDAHYLNENDAFTQEVLFAIKDGKQIGDPARRKAYAGTYIKTPEEMAIDFADLPLALENTIKIADKVENFDITFNRVQPVFFDNNKKKTKEYLDKEVFTGLKEKYPEVTKDLEERVNYELSIVDDKGYNDYFLVMADVVKYARDRDIPVSVRGSVAGSVVAYALGIINIEPISWELYFERFLNPERNSPPDIDLDIADIHRDELLQYVTTKYGEDNVCLIATFGRMKTKSAIRDVCRVMGIELATADKLSKMVHIKYGRVKPIAQMMEDDVEFAREILGNSSLESMRDVVQNIEGMARHVSTHACGVLITPEPVTNYIAVQKEGNGGDKIITQVEGSYLEDLGLMKFDFLGLRNLTIIKKTVDLVKQDLSINIDIQKIPLDDAKTFQLFQKGETTAVFQMESSGMKQYLKKLHPETLEDLCFMAAAYRPGPMQFIDPYIDCKQGRKEPEYLIPEMKPILEKTYGYAIYQEQVIRIAVDIAGYTMGEADILRRAMGKKKMSVMKKEEKKFINGVIKKGYDKQIALQIWEYMLPFADYGFNKAHAASYAMVSYWTAYLKSHYPIQFIAALIESDINDYDRLVIDIEESERMGIEVLPPSINKSGVKFWIEEHESQDCIRYGLGGIKGANSHTIEELVNERVTNSEFNSFMDSFTRPDFTKIHKKTYEILVMVGAFDDFGDRKQLLQMVEPYYSFAEKEHKQRVMGQVGLFGEEIDNQMQQNSKDNLPKVKPASNIEKMQWEKDMLGIFFSTHPLKNYLALFKAKGAICDNRFMENEKDGEVILVGATMVNKRQITTKKGDPMAFVKFETINGVFEGVVFPRTYLEYDSVLIPNILVLVKGKISDKDGRRSFLVDEVAELKDSLMSDIVVEELDNIKPVKQPLKIFISIPAGTDREKVDKIRLFLQKNPGDAKVVFKIEKEDGVKQIELKQGVNFEVVSKAFRPSADPSAVADGVVEK